MDMTMRGQASQAQVHCYYAKTCSKEWPSRRKLGWFDISFTQQPPAVATEWKTAQREAYGIQFPQPEAKTHQAGGLIGARQKPLDMTRPTYSGRRHHEAGIIHTPASISDSRCAWAVDRHQSTQHGNRRCFGMLRQPGVHAQETNSANLPRIF